MVLKQKDEEILNLGDPRTVCASNTCTQLIKIDGIDSCNQCGCARKEHMHITYEICKFMINIETNTGNNTQSPIDAVNKRIKDLKEEQEAIIKSNGVENQGVIVGLEKLLADYRREMEVPTQAIKSSPTPSSTNPLDAKSIIKQDEIFILVGKLYRLPIYGANIRAQINEMKRVQSRSMLDREHIVNLPTETESSSVMTDLKKNSLIKMF
ncbi:unnamed protein product [Rotaria magnacalcarata]|nr:unnamed protein product [Rotaria magnacalcarata]